MKPRFNHAPMVGSHLNGAAACGGNPLPPRATAPAAATRGMRSAWLKLQLFVAGVRHSNKLRLL